MLCRKMHLHAQIKAHRRFYTQNLLQRETFAQNNFYTKILLHRKTLTQKNLSTQTAQKKCHRQFYMQRNFFAQKPLRAEVIMHSSFYTGPSTHRCLYSEKLLHRNFCTQHTFTHSKLLITRRGFASPSWSPTFRVPPLKWACQWENHP